MRMGLCCWGEARLVMFVGFFWVFGGRGELLCGGGRDFEDG